VAYTKTIEGPVVAEIAGRRHLSWTITEGGVTASDSFELPGLPLFFTLTLFEALLENAGTASTISPVVSLDSQDGLDEVASTAEAGTYIRNDCPVPVFSPRANLHVMSTPDTGTATKIVTRISIVEGHMA